MNEREHWLNELCLDLMRAYRSAMRSYASYDTDADPLDDAVMARAIGERMTLRGVNAMSRALNRLSLSRATESQMTTDDEKPQ